MELANLEKISLKNHPNLNETWLQEKIADDPQILGLGDLVLLDRERQQKSGRLDLLLTNVDTNSRYEVEIQLGTTDESHIIRCIEYWDIEKRRYPHYDHCAVLIAEDITSRFLNVLSLFNGHIPMMILQLNALKIDDRIALNFVKVMDRFELRKDDESEVNLTETNREYWNDRANPKTVKIADKILDIINEKAKPTQYLNYNKYYIGLSDGVKSRNFIHFKPKKQFTHILFEIDQKEDWAQKLEDSDMSAEKHDKWLKVTLTPGQVDKNLDLLEPLIFQSVEIYNNN
ncbi:hypothetical protein [Fodinibius saliphilus]|uniref:hypothetical protein n=1 Tax=Fodinibius saliphilus TaxID=1920650 RepID=UPI001108DE40|nr:hypothetical protein [Fodinibius saliphilus]